MHEGQWLAIFICLLMGLYFLLTGIRAIHSGRMTVVNPDHSSAYPGILGKIMLHAKNTGVPQWQIDSQSPSSVIQGSDALLRGVVYIVFGVIILLIAAAYVAI